MKISYNWLSEYLSLNISPNEIAVILTDIGLEVEGITAFESVKGGLEGLVIGEILSVKPHPNADRLQLTKVNVGHAEPLDIVCGAPNVAVGQKVVVALVGSTLYSDEKGFTIKKSKIRGEISEGMICAEDEIGLGKSHEGIMVLEDTAKVGMPASEYFQIAKDTVFEIGLTPNRIDAASHYGVARDLAAYLQLNDEVELKKPSITKFKQGDSSFKIEVQVEDDQACPRYSGITINNLKVTGSPKWLQNRLRSIGLKPINNIVDVTNFVLHEMGQPLHAFDASKIIGNKIIVKRSGKERSFTTLDGIERTMSAEDLLICNKEDAMAIAGVFGGLNSGVTEQTTAIFIESAYFNPVDVRKTAKRHGLNTDASYRYERGSDPNITVFALKRAALLIQELAGGEIGSEMIDHYPKPIEDYLIELNYKTIDRLIGQSINKDIIKSILKNLEIKILNESSNTLRLSVPAYRVDVQREVDVIEEILRIYGYNNIKLPEFLRTNISSTNKNTPHKIENIISNFLSSNGFSEIFNNSLTNPNYYQDQEALVKMLNPLSSETEVLRTSLLYGGLESIAYNLNRKKKSLMFYEFGKTYKFENSKYLESKQLAIWMTGDLQKESWMEKSKAVNFFSLKGNVENILSKLGISNWKIKKESDSIFSASLTYLKGKKRLVSFGKLKQAELEKADVKEAVFYAEFDWDQVLSCADYKPVKFQPISKYPSVRRDLALLIDHEVTFDQLRSIALNTEKSLLKEINLFDEYVGKNIAPSKKSYAVSLFFQDEEKTLTDKKIDQVMERLIGAFKSELKAELR